MEARTLGQRLHLDWPLLGALLLLSGLGLLALYSAGNQDAGLLYRQVIKLGLALGAMLLVAQVPPARLAGWSVWLYAGGILLLALVLLFGDVGKGAQRWLDLGVVRFQPSELMKLALPLLIAAYLANRPLPPGPLCSLVVAGLILLPVLLIARQPDLGTALLIAAAGFALLFIAGLSWRLLAALGGLAAVSLPLLWHFMHDYQRRRVLTFLQPESDPLGAGYHTIQAQIAIGSGGLYGKGWLNGTQSHLEFLPERATDFIFAVICEEFGLLGALLLVGLYLFIIGRGLYIALAARHTFGRLLAGGLTLTFFLYVFVNMGMVSGQLPVVGVPLPLVSYGGTSMITLLLGFGILMAIHTHRRALSFE